MLGGSATEKKKYKSSSFFTFWKNHNILGEIKTESAITKIFNDKKKLFCTIELNAGARLSKWMTK